MSEMINIPINVRDLLGKIDAGAMVRYCREYGELSELLEEIDSDELIEHLGGIDKILEDNPGAVSDHIANMNKSDRECAQERY